MPQMALPLLLVLKYNDPQPTINTMVIDGKAIAQDILDSLSKKIEALKETGVVPHVAVILIGDDASSTAYVKQKELKVKQIGAEISVFRYTPEITEDELLTKIEELNTNKNIHGIIIQRPLPAHIDPQKITNATFVKKDIDGFAADSPFDPPVALAVWKCLEQVKDTSLTTKEWLEDKKIVILGKGQTAGKPIIRYFQKQNLLFTVIDSKTEDREYLIKDADIIISAVGKENVITQDMIKPGVILIGVGMFQNREGKLRGDYVAEDISEKAGSYTPVLGGVGPINVAMLLSNLVKATTQA